MVSLSTNIVGSNWPHHVDQLTSDGLGPVWVAADESGSTGENLVDSQGVISHATIRIDDQSAASILEELRSKAGALQAPEVKFSQFAKRRGLAALSDAMASGGSLDGRVNISVGDKRYVTVSKMIDLLVEEEAHERGVDMYSDMSARDMARTLLVDGSRGLGELWEPLMAAFVSLARATQRGGRPKEDVDTFFDRLDQCRWRCRRRSVERILIALLRTRKHAEELVRSTERGAMTIPALDPMVAILPLNIEYWYTRLGPFRLLHDEHNLFTSEFTRDFFLMLWNAHSILPHAPRLRVAEFSVGNSKSHPSIQIADLVASAGRVVVEAHLGKKTDAADLLRESVLRHIRPPWLLANEDIGHHAEDRASRRPFS